MAQAEEERLVNVLGRRMEEVSLIDSVWFRVGRTRGRRKGRREGGARRVDVGTSELAAIR